MHQYECAKGSGSAHVCVCPWACKGIGLSGLGLTSACAHVCKKHVAHMYAGVGELHTRARANECLRGGFCTWG